MTSLALPYPVFGPRPKAHAVLAAVFPDETDVIDGGACKCRAIDKVALRRFEALHGSSGIRAARRTYGTAFLEADWTITPTSVFYISPGPGFIWRRTWDQVDVVVPGKRRRRHHEVVVIDIEGEEWAFRMAPAAAANFLAAASHLVAE